LKTSGFVSGISTVRNALTTKPEVKLAAVLSVTLGSSVVGLAVAATLLTPMARVPAQVQGAPGCAQRMHAQLYFGLQGPHGPIPEPDWEAFLLEVVTPRFPDGLTVLHATGQWRKGAEPVQREASRVIEIVYDESPRVRRLIDEVAAIYKARFQQQSVMVVRSPAYVCF
jgi:hypothetical protein